MNRTKTTLYLCILCSAALTLAGVILRSLAMLFFFDAEVGYFQWKALSVICQIISTAAVLFPIGVCIAIPKGTLASRWQGKPISVTAVVLAAVFAGLSIYKALTLFFISPEQATFLSYALICLPLAAAAYFFLGNSIAQLKEKRTLLTLLGLCAVFWALAGVADTYFDLFTAMNSPVKTILQYGFLGFALMMISELRFGLGKGMPRMGVCAHCLAMFFCLTGGISTVLGAIAHSQIATDYLMYGLALLFAGVYAAVRLYVYAARLTLLDNEEETA